MTIDNKFDENGSLKRHFDILKSRINESEESVWSVIRNYIAEVPEFKKDLEDSDTHLFRAAHYYLGSVPQKTNLIRQAVMDKYPALFGN